MCAWWVGDRRNVKVWLDKWLLANYIPKSEDCEVIKVADLINPNSEGWKIEWSTRSLISNVSLSALGVKDRLI